MSPPPLPGWAATIPSGRHSRGSAVSAAITLCFALAAIIWSTTTGYRGEFALLCAMYSLVALGMYVPFIMGGALSLAYASYVLIGGYSVALIGTETDWWLGLAFPAGMAISAAAAVVLGFATRRLSSFYLAAVTLLFSIAFQELLLSADFTGGATGIGGVRELAFFGTTLGRNAVIALAIMSVWALAILLGNLRRSQFGVALRSQRERRVAVEATGIMVGALQLVALAVGAAVASLGGSFFVLVQGGVHPDTFTVELVFLVIFMPLLGGQFTPWGSVLGAVLVGLFTFYLTFFKSSGSMLFALAVLAVLLLAPGGLLGWLQRLAHVLLRRGSPR